MEPFLDVGQQPGDAQDGDDHGLIADLIHGQAEEVPHLDGSGLSSRLDLVGAGQLGGDHGGPHGRTEIDVAAEALDGGEADKHREEGEGGRGDEVDDVVVVREPREPVDKAVRTSGVVRGNE